MLLIKGCSLSELFSDVGRMVRTQRFLFSVVKRSENKKFGFYEFSVLFPVFEWSFA